MKVNPGTVVTAIAVFTKSDPAGGPATPGKWDGPARWSSSNGKDIVSPAVDDLVAGTSTVTVDGTANSTGDTTVLTVAADPDLGKGTQVLSATSETIEWTDTVDVEADGVTITLSA